MTTEEVGPAGGRGLGEYNICEDAERDDPVTRWVLMSFYAGFGVHSIRQGLGGVERDASRVGAPNSFNVVA